MWLWLWSGLWVPRALLDVSCGARRRLSAVVYRGPAEVGVWRTDEARGCLRLVQARAHRGGCDGGALNTLGIEWLVSSTWWCVVRGESTPGRCATRCWSWVTWWAGGRGWVGGRLPVLCVRCLGWCGLCRLLRGRGCGYGRACGCRAPFDVSCSARRRVGGGLPGSGAQTRRGRRVLLQSV